MAASTGGLRKCRHDCAAAATLEPLQVVRSSHGNDHVFQSAHNGAPRPQPQYNAAAAVVTLAGDATKVEVISVATPSVDSPKDIAHSGRASGCISGSLGVTSDVYEIAFPTLNIRWRYLEGDEHALLFPNAVAPLSSDSRHSTVDELRDDSVAESRDSRGGVSRCVSRSGREILRAKLRSHRTPIVTYGPTRGDRNRN
ncbi:hypothetical protein MTO96_023254 [Rhipicephalus appendiculatus]